MLVSTPDDADEIRVLIVDDEPLQLELMKVNLMDADPAFRVETVSDPVKALELIRDGSYDCVVSDFQMPGMDGVKLCNEIRAFNDIPFIIYTGRGSEEVASEAFSAGVDDYVRKERELTHFTVLARRVRGAVESKRAERALRESEERSRRLATVLMDSNDAVTMQDLEGRILAWNRGAENLYGYSESEALGGSIEMLVPEDERAQASGFLESVRRSEPVESLEVKRLTKTGRVLDVWLTTTKLVDENGNTFAVATTERDVTERNRMVEDLRARTSGYLSRRRSSPLRTRS